MTYYRLLENPTTHAEYVWRDEPEGIAGPLPERPEDVPIAYAWLRYDPDSERIAAILATCEPTGYGARTPDPWPAEEQP